MSHDLKTPLTRLRLQVEALDDPPMQARIGHELDEMEGMVREALSLFRGLDDGEPVVPLDIDALLVKIREEFALLGAEVTVSGHAQRPFPGKPQMLKRCLTNLIANAIKFGGQADVLVEDGLQLTIRVRDPGPGIPVEELERVFEPFYRLETSRNRDSGGTGLGLSIARDIAQAHGGTLALHNMSAGGLEARLVLPRTLANA
jgi:signal transduction histidine kinase